MVQTPLPEFSIQIIAGVADTRAGFRRTHAPGLDRIAAVDSAVMRVAVWEMLENDEVSPINVIDEVSSRSFDRSRLTRRRHQNAVLDAIRATPRFAWSRRSLRKRKCIVSDEDESSPDDQLPAQEAPARALPAGAKPLMAAASKTSLTN